MVANILKKAKQATKKAYNKAKPYVKKIKDFGSKTGITEHLINAAENATVKKIHGRADDKRYPGSQQDRDNYKKVGEYITNKAGSTVKSQLIKSEHRAKTKLAQKSKPLKVKKSSSVVKKTSRKPQEARLPTLDSRNIDNK